MVWQHTVGGFRSELLKENWKEKEGFMPLKVLQRNVETGVGF